MSKDLDLNDRFLHAIDQLNNTEKHLFITGVAGTGKSTLLRYFCDQTTKAFAVVAPTGVAAVNIGGETIHSFFGFKPGVVPTDAKDLAHKSSKKKLFLALETLIIDEISMVRADLLDTIDYFLRVVRQDPTPFGGVQLVMIGDLFQLPPVVTNDEKDALLFAYRSPYFFSSTSFENLLENYQHNFSFIELHKIYRQSEKEFINLLNKVRNKTASYEDIALINQHTNRIPKEEAIVLTATNAQADTLNETKLQTLKTKTKVYYGKTEGGFPSTQLPTATEIALKEGARVMLLNNDSSNRWINGTLGTVTKTQDQSVRVLLDSGEEVSVEPFTWTQFRTTYDEKTNRLKKENAGSYTQLPLRLAWAVTIHKAQGKTFDEVTVDLGYRAFAHGQTYVALSRCRTLAGLTLKRPLNLRDLLLDHAVVEFINKLKILSL